MNGTALCMCIPVYVSVCTYTMYLTPFPEVITQEISLPYLSLYHCFCLQILVHSRNTNILSLKLVSYLLITQNEKVAEVLEYEALLEQILNIQESCASQLFIQLAGNVLRKKNELNLKLTNHRRVAKHFTAMIVHSHTTLQSFSLSTCFQAFRRV